MATGRQIRTGAPSVLDIRSAMLRVFLHHAANTDESPWRIGTSFVSRVKRIQCSRM